MISRLTAPPIAGGPSPAKPLEEKSTHRKASMERHGAGIAKVKRERSAETCKVRLRDLRSPEETEARRFLSALEYSQ